MSVSDAQLEEQILEEQQTFARSVQTELWDDGISEGIDPEILALVGVDTLVCLLMKASGPDAVQNLVQSICLRLESGAFHSHEFMN